MEEKESQEELRSIVQAGVDAVSAYGQALEGVPAGQIREAFERFRADYELHTSRLFDQLKQFDTGAAAMSPPDPELFAVEEMDAEGALHAIREIEETTYQRFHEGLSLDLPGSVLPILDQALEDIRRHKDFLDHALKERVWKDDMKWGPIDIAPEDVASL